MDDGRIRAARLLASSRYAMPIAEARRHIDERRRRLLAAPAPAPDPDFTAPEPFPPPHPVDDPSGFAEAFWKRRGTPAHAPAEPPGRPPKGDLSPEHERFRVLDGGKEPHGDNDA